MSLTQSTTALSLIRYGVGLQLAGLLWGPIFPMLPYPRMGLTVHIQCMSNGNPPLPTYRRNKEADRGNFDRSHGSSDRPPPLPTQPLETRPDATEDCEMGLHFGDCTYCF